MTKPYPGTAHRRRVFYDAWDALGLTDPDSHRRMSMRVWKRRAQRAVTAHRPARCPECNPSGNPTATTIRRRT